MTKNKNVLVSSYFENVNVDYLLCHVSKQNSVGN